MNQPPVQPIVHPIYEPTTGTYQYLIASPTTHAAILIDPVLDFDPLTSTILTTSANSLLALITQNNYTVHYILETHIHADHLSSASYLASRLHATTGSKPATGIGAGISGIQRHFSARYGIPASEHETAFDRLFSPDEVFHAADLTVQALHLPGHTPDHTGYLIGSNLFCGDSLFHADIGSARCDFPGGSAVDLWRSAQRILALPEETKVWVGHDYPPAGKRKPVACLTVGQHRELNVHVGGEREEEEFVRLREERDKVLGAPRLLHQSLQVNVRGGELPGADGESGMRMLRVPVKVEGSAGWVD